MPSNTNRLGNKVAGCLCCFGEQPIADDTASITSESMDILSEYTSLLDPLTSKKFSSLFPRRKHGKRSAPVPTNPFTVVTGSETESDWLPSLPADVQARGAANHEQSPPLSRSWTLAFRQWLIYDNYNPEDQAETASVPTSSSWETTDLETSVLIPSSPLTGKPAAPTFDPTTPQDRIIREPSNTSSGESSTGSSSSGRLRRVAGLSNIREVASASSQGSPDHANRTISINQPRWEELASQPSTLTASSAERLRRELGIPHSGLPQLDDRCDTPSPTSPLQLPRKPPRSPTNWADASEMGSDSSGSLQRLREQLIAPSHPMDAFADGLDRSESHDTEGLENAYGAHQSTDLQDANERFFESDMSQASSHQSNTKQPARLHINEPAGIQSETNAIDHNGGGEVAPEEHQNVEAHESLSGRGHGFSIQRKPMRVLLTLVNESSRVPSPPYRPQPASEDADVSDSDTQFTSSDRTGLGPMLRMQVLPEPTESDHSDSSLERTTRLAHAERSRRPSRRA